ncbi:MAG: hypothetical protein HOK30_11220, partial [Rhodospirillaceae bacterium]|nr:hypothetical protein [Rhodospirillaceae bacterium]
MDPLANDLLQGLSETSTVSQLAILDVAIALVLSTALTFAIAKAYIHTHAGYSYSKTFVQSIVLVGITVAVRRHINWNTQGPDLKEGLAHLVQDIKRRVCGIASAGIPS